MTLEEINATLERLGIAPFTDEEIDGLATSVALELCGYVPPDNFTDLSAWRRSERTIRKLKNERTGCRVVDSCEADSQSADNRVSALVAAFELVSPGKDCEPSNDSISIFELAR